MRPEFYSRIFTKKTKVIMLSGLFLYVGASVKIEAFAREAEAAVLEPTVLPQSAIEKPVVQQEVVTPEINLEVLPPISKPAAEISLFEGKGQVIEIEPIYNQITIKHKAIKGFAPPGEAVFFVESKDLLKEVKPKEWVYFILAVEKNDVKIKQIEKSSVRPDRSAAKAELLKSASKGAFSQLSQLGVEVDKGPKSEDYSTDKYEAAEELADDVVFEVKAKTREIKQSVPVLGFLVGTTVEGTADTISYIGKNAMRINKRLKAANIHVKRNKIIYRYRREF